MRAAALCVVVACGAPPAPQKFVPPLADTVPIAAEDPSPAASELPTFGKPGELYALTVDRGAPSCERWAIDSDAHQLFTPTQTLTYAIAGHSLNVSRGDCKASFAITEAADAITANRSTWFRTSAACQAAITAHARVATEVPCPLELVAADPATVRTTFATIAAKGGVMYDADPRGCVAVTFTPGHYELDKTRHDIKADPAYLDAGVALEHGMYFEKSRCEARVAAASWFPG